jgi:hypothetical protein
VVERKEESGCEKSVSTSGAFNTGCRWVANRSVVRWYLVGEGMTNLEGVIEDEYDYAVCECVIR